MALHEHTPDERARRRAGSLRQPARTGFGSRLPSQASDVARSRAFGQQGARKRRQPRQGVPERPDALSPYLDLTRRFMWPGRPVQRPPSQERAPYPGSATVPDDARRALLMRLIRGLGDRG
ncbi:hypothetical protein LCGC14_2421410 [marine sediment metagenome]|uniref:Uncharacterized protein n=1 Tax=marine sediment metagenome TaxID=412755 RepID=A0A0F9BPN7_9ZZZZ